MDTRFIDKPIAEMEQTLKNEGLLAKFKNWLAGLLGAPIIAMFYRDQGEKAAGQGFKGVLILGLISGAFVFQGDEITTRFGILDYTISGALISFMILRQIVQNGLVWERERRGLFVYSGSPGRPPRWAAWAAGPRPTWIKLFAMVSLVPIVIGTAILPTFPGTAYLLIGCGVAGLLASLLNYSVARDRILERRDAVLMHAILESENVQNTTAASDSPTLPGVNETAATGRGENYLAAALYDGRPRQIKTGQAATRPEAPGRTERPEEPDNSAAPTFSQPQPETANIRKK